MTGGVQIAERIQAMDARAWDEASAEVVALDRDLLAAIEEIDERASRRRYFMARDGHTSALASGSLRLAREEARPLDQLLFGRAAGALRMVGLSSARVLWVAPDLGHECSLHAGAGAGAGARADAAQLALLHELCAAIEREARRCDAAVCLSRVVDEDCPALDQVLQARGYARSLEPPLARLEVGWRDWDGYVAHLAQRSARDASNARREAARFSAAGGAVESVALGAADSRHVSRLLEAHQRRKNGDGLGLRDDFAAVLARRLGERARLYAASPVAETRAVALLLRRGQRGCIPLVGIEHGRELPEFAYFNVTYYGPAADAGPLGLRRIDLGPGMVPMKLRRGCRIVRPQVYFRARSALGRRWRHAAFLAHGLWYRRKFRDAGGDEGDA